jgi:hypothetical protein
VVSFLLLGSVLSSAVSAQHTPREQETPLTAIGYLCPQSQAENQIIGELGTENINMLFKSVLCLWSESLIK